MASAAGLLLSLHPIITWLVSPAGDYDYDESDELPAGCEYADAQLAHMIDADSRLDGSQTQVQIVCKPVPARRADAGSNSAAPQESSGREGFQFYAALLATTVVCFNLFFLCLGILWLSLTIAMSGTLGPLF